MIKKIMEKVYNCNDQMVLSKKEINEVKSFYKKNFSKVNSLEEFLNLNDKIKNIIKKSKSIEFEIQNQISNGKALQAGILAECVLIQSLAKILEFNNFINLEKDQNYPVQLNKHLNQKDPKYSARYVYFKDENNMLLQCGSPYSVADAVLYLDNQEIKIEIKDAPALIGCFDLFYDEEGKLIYSEKVKENFPCYIPVIEKINKNINVFRSVGKNFSFEIDNEIFFNHYFEEKKIDLFMICDENSELVILRREDLKNNLVVKNFKIRFKGKNGKEIFTPSFFQKALKAKNVKIDDAFNCLINKNNVKEITAHGGSKVSRIEFSDLFFITSKKFRRIGDKFSFNIKNIKQTKSAISGSIHLIKNKKKLKAEILEKVSA